MSSSTDVEVCGNIVIVDADYGNGITALWTDRHLNYAVVGHTPPLRVENINVHNNDITYLGVLNIQNATTPCQELKLQPVLMSAAQAVLLMVSNQYAFVVESRCNDYRSKVK